MGLVDPCSCRKPQLDLSESEREGVMHVLKCIFPILCLASAAPELGTAGNDRLLQNLVDTLVGKVSNFANQIFTIAAFAHESFSKPSSSLPAYNNSAYQQQGKVVELGSGLRIYTVGEGADRPCVIWNYDIEGFDGGRTRERCDQLASKGFMVILPDYYHGAEAQKCSSTDFFCWMGLKPFTVANSNWTQLQSDWNLVRSWAEEKGVTRFAAVGTCWGSYMTLRMSSLPEVVAGVMVHPSHPTLIPDLGEDEAVILGQVGAPQMIMPTRTDSNNVQPGGLDENTLKEKGLEVSVEPFPTMSHGFLTRGNMEDPNVAAEVARAMNITVEFLNNQFGK